MNLDSDKRKVFERIKDVTVSVKIRVGKKKINFSDLKKLKVHDRFEYDKIENNTVDLLIGDEVVAKAKIVSENEIEIIEKKYSKREK